METLFIKPGSPWENGYVESFNGKLRDELLDREIFYTLAEAKILIERWQREYNTVRPHGALAYRPPAPEAISPACLNGMMMSSALSWELAQPWGQASLTRADMRARRFGATAASGVAPDEPMGRRPPSTRIVRAMWRLAFRLGVLLGALVVVAPATDAQSVVPTPDNASSPSTSQASDGGTREAAGRVIVRATRLTAPLVVDGRLDEAVYSDIPPAANFIQQEPLEGEPATEDTDVWVFFDNRNLYIAGRCWDSHPERAVSNEMRRDAVPIFDDEFLGVGLDTFHDRRNGFLFTVNLSGGLHEAYITDERDFNGNWNTVWDAKTMPFERGWTIEFVIPFKSLRYNNAPNQTWGINFRRSVRWKNEVSHLTQVPAAMGRRGIFKISSYGTLVGLEPPRSGRTFELKPYAITDVSTDRTLTPPISNEVGGDVGLDAKFGVTKGLTADVTYNTDFAQVEVDEQQINLTRFNLFFREKRDFFLEGQGIFTFGGVQNRPRNAIGPTGINGQNPNPADMPNLFFSRKIGLAAGEPIPISAGGRITGKSGPFSIGILDIRTREVARLGVPATNFGVVRLKRDVLRRSTIGMLYTHRSIDSSGRGANSLIGVDGVFGFFTNLNINTYIAKTASAAPGGDGMSYRAQLDYNSDRYGLQLEHMLLDDEFNPDMGFVRRTDFRRNSAFVRFSPRPTASRIVRKHTFDATYDYIADTSGRLQSRNAEAAYRTDLQNGDGLAVEYAQNYEFLEVPLALTERVTVPTGGYSFSEVRGMYWFGPQRAATGIVKLIRGQFYDGTRTELSVFKSLISLTPRLSVEPGLTIDWLNLPQARFQTSLISARTIYALTPRAAVTAFLQYISIAHAVSVNARFRWEYTPGSDLFVVYTDRRDTRQPGFPALQDRVLAVKFTRLLRF